MPPHFGGAHEQHHYHNVVYFSRGLFEPLLSPRYNFANASIQEELKAAPTCAVMLQMRHPFDSAVSAFQSFTTPNHYIGFPKDSAGYNETLQARAVKHEMGDDKYAISVIPGYAKYIQLQLQNLALAERQGCEVWISRYEDMILFPRTFFVKLSTLLRVRKDGAWRHTINQLVKEQEDLLPDEHSHTAYIFPGQFRQALRNDTILKLTDMIPEYVLQHSGYF